MATDSEVSLTSNQRSELNSIAQSRTLPAGYVFRAKLILMLAEGASFNTIKRRLQTSAPTIIRWKQRFLESGLDGLDTYHPGQKATVLTPALNNSFLIEEAYNQEDGVIQHISTFERLTNSRDWVYTQTDEWPLRTYKHQLSVTLGATHAGSFAGSGAGWGDTAFNYRYQLVACRRDFVSMLSQTTAAG